MYSAGSMEAVAQSGFIQSGKRANSKEISLSARSSQTGNRAWCLVVGTLRSDGVPSRSHGYQSYSPKRVAPNKTLKLPSNSRVHLPAGHFGHSGHQIGKLLYKPSIENFPKPLSYPSKVSNPPLPLDNRATLQPLRQRLT